MIRTTLLVMVLAVGSAVHLDAAGQAGGRAAAGIGKALSDMADREIELENAMRLARQKADLEVETARRLRQLQQERPATPQDSPTDDGIVYLARQHPQWKRIVTSKMFDSWLQIQRDSYQRECRETRHGGVLSMCIDDFFGSTVTR